ncbi:MAG: lipid biosynthesis lauroyl acyltransferase, partial [Myxococcaceae bacterium]|nr:lipid biosynthesis lauroyl acyltransferase [Myxococcaceae bacterium]
LALLPLTWASALGAAFGALAFALARGERNKALESLRRAFPHQSDAERTALARACFRHLGRSLFELVCVAQLDRQVEQWVRWSPQDRAVLDAALARKKGVVFVSGHLGSWELLARRVALAGYPCQTIAKETTDPRTTALIEKFRESAKLRSIWRGRSGAAKAMLRALKAGQILGLLIDQDTDVQSVWVPFFGHAAKTPRAAADLALRTGAAVVMGFCRREADGRYRLSMKELPTLGLQPEALTARMTEQIEAAVRAAPEQWVWMHRRWKSAPPPAD